MVYNKDNNMRRKNDSKDNKDKEIKNKTKEHDTGATSMRCCRTTSRTGKNTTPIAYSLSCYPPIQRNSSTNCVVGMRGNRRNTFYVSISVFQVPY